MTKALFFLLFLTFFSLAALWFVENDGSMVIEWMGYRVQTSVAFAILFMIITIVICTLFLQTILWLKSAPRRYKRAVKERKLNRGLTALTQGFAAIAAGDIKEARALTSRASSNLDNMPLTKLLAAQTAQLEGNRELAREHYTAMLGDKETEIIAIKGLLIEAKQDSDLTKALFLAEKASRLRPNADWVILILLDLYKKLKKWQLAEDSARKALKYNLINRESANQTFAMLAFARYLELARTDNIAGGNFIKTAYKLRPEFPGITAAYARNLMSRNKLRKATRILENQWSKTPHPDIAAAYMEIYSDEAAEKRLERAEKLLKLCSFHAEGHVLVAAAALEAEQTEKARQHLNIALGCGETTAICLLMAELESLDRGGHQLIHSWRERAVAAQQFGIWKCLNCGNKSQKWSSNCQDCNSFDALEWQAPQVPVNIVRSEVLLGAGG